MVRPEREQIAPGRLSGMYCIRATTVIAVAGAMLGVSMVVGGFITRPRLPVRENGPPRQTTTLAGLPVIGSPTAPVVFILFSDFECPFCARFGREVWPVLRARWIDTGQVQVAFRYLPPDNSTRASRVVDAAGCAAKQGRFWSMHDALFADPPHELEEELMADASRAGVDRVAFRDCMANGGAGQALEDAEMANALGVVRAPTFLVGRLGLGRRVTLAGALYGRLPIEQFDKAIEALKPR